jgi:SNF2 family DNA or RNA helicase
MRLHQIVCGHLKTDDGEVVEIKSNRINALMEVLDETSGKVIIWATYRHDIKAIVQAITEEYGAESVVHFYGDTDSEERRFARLAFQNHPKVRYFVGNPATGRFGLTLTASCTAVYYSNSYDLEHRTQSEDRIHRIGQTMKCNYVDLIARNTVDERIIKALKLKKNIGAMVIGDDIKAWLAPI